MAVDQYIETLMILIGIPILYELKARIDAIGFSNIKDKKSRRTWHIQAWLYIVVVSILVGEGYACGFNKYFVYVLLYMATLRASFFPIRLNFLRDVNNPWYHLGTEGWDKAVRWVFRGNTKLFFIIISILTVISATILWLDMPPM